MIESRRVDSARPLNYDAGSFRDRDGRIFYREGEVFRALSLAALDDWKAVSAQSFFQQAMRDGRIVETSAAPCDAAGQNDEWAGLLRHARIPFISYPYEWTFGMLRDAALLQLELLREALAADMILKDATAYNTQWVGARPTLIDVSSFRRLQPGEPWPGYRQFCQFFLYPLMLQAYRGIPFQPLLRGRLDGIEPETCNRMLSLRDWLRPGVFTHVHLHARLQARYARRGHVPENALPAAGFHKGMIAANVEGLSRLVQRLKWAPDTTVWTDYASRNSYTPDDRRLKEEFVREAVHTKRWRLAWDFGCNTGAFARIAAESADTVVAMDADSTVIEGLYNSLRRDGNTQILPLVNNVADPSPGLGWRGRERGTLADRGQPDLILCLALVHHLVMGANIPLQELLEWLATYRAQLIIEFVPKSDPMVQQLLAGRPDIYSDYDQRLFEDGLNNLFSIERRQAFQGNGRILYFARPRN